MIVVHWIDHKNKTHDITNMVASVSWTGSISQVARQAEITILNAPNDNNITNMKVILRNGDLIKLYENNKLIYYGQVLKTEKSNQTGTITYTTYDFLYHLMQSTYTHKWKKKTAEAIAKSVCKKVGIQRGSFAKTKYRIKKLIADDMSIYSIIMTAYTKASKKTHQKYVARMNGRKCNVYKVGTKVTGFNLSDSKNLISVSYEESAENVINKVVIFNKKRKKKGTVKNKSSIKTFGTFQKTYTKGKKGSGKRAAKKLLQGIEKTVNVEVDEGNINCISGNGIKVYDTATGLNAIFWIESDTHTFANGRHTMSLELSFKKVWDRQDN